MTGQQPTDCIPKHIGTYDEAASQACADIDASERWLRGGGLRLLVERAKDIHEWMPSGNAILDHERLDDLQFRLYEALKDLP